MRKKENLRFNMLIGLIYILGLVLLGFLFNMQIVNGKYYRQIGTTRLIKEANIEAARGKILDETGEIYANSSIQYDVEMFKTKIDDDKFNNAAVKLLNILEKNEDKYFKKLPIDITKFEFIGLDNEKIIEWKKSLNLPKEASAEECFLRLKDKYNINMHENTDVLKVLEIRELVRTNPDGSAYPTKIAENIKRQTAIKIMENAYDIPGVNITTKPVRVYEKKHEAAHTIGYIAPISDKEYQEKKEEGYKQKDKIGKTGIERTFEKLLKGKNGSKHIEMNVEGGITGEYITKEPVGGADIILTINSKLQSQVEKILIKHFNELRNGTFQVKTNPKGASAIVMDIKTGDVLAMVSYPEYDPQKFVNGISSKDWEEYRNSPLNPLINRSIQGLYSPASIFKMSTAMAALDSGAVMVDEGVVCTGKYHKYHQPVCWIHKYGMTHGWQNVSLAIKNSCNIFFYEMGDRIKEEKIAEYAKYFGMGRKTGIEIVGEEEGFLATRETAQKKGQIWNPGDHLSAAIGQSYNSFTPIQMVKYIAMIANGGKEIRPTIIKNIIKSDGIYLDKEEITNISDETTGFKDIKIPEKQFKEEHLNAVRTGMNLVTKPGGTAYDTFGNFHINIAAKTGTAEAGENINGIFASYAPYNNPEIAVVVIIENGYEGYFTAKVVREIYEAYFSRDKKEITEDSNANLKGERVLY